jgi:hypothetical protein
MRSFTILEGPSKPEIIQAARSHGSVRFKVTASTGFTYIAGTPEDVVDNRDDSVDLKLDHPVIKAKITGYDPVRQTGAGHYLLQRGMRDKFT